MKYVVYTHTDYLDVVTVHSEYLKYEYNTLVINKNDLVLDELYSKFQEIIFYDDNLPYAGRLYQSLKQIDSEHVFLIHDMDIPLSIDKETIEKLLNYAKDNYIDRLDLQHESYEITENSIVIEAENFEKIIYTDIENYKLCLVRSYLYNVNPSIWKKEVLLDILSNFINESYRTIESNRVCKYCERYSMYKLYTNNIVCTGYYNATPVFIFLHITHGGGLMPPNYEKIDHNVRKSYLEILAKYKFNRPIKQNMW